MRIDDATLDELSRLHRAYHEATDRDSTTKAAAELSAAVGRLLIGKTETSTTDATSESPTYGDHVKKIIDGDEAPEMKHIVMMVVYEMTNTTAKWPFPGTPSVQDLARAVVRHLNGILQ